LHQILTARAEPSPPGLGHCLFPRCSLLTGLRGGSRDTSQVSAHFQRAFLYSQNKLKHIYEKRGKNPRNMHNLLLKKELHGQASEHGRGSSRDPLCAAAASPVPPSHPVHQTTEIVLPVSRQKSETAGGEGAAAAGWVLPPELGGKQPLPQRHGTGERLGSWVQCRRPPLALSRDLGSSLWFSICSCPVYQLPACAGHLGAWSSRERAAGAGLDHAGGRKYGEGAGNPVLLCSLRAFLGRDWLCQSSRGNENLSRALCKPSCVCGRNRR